jgi:hypothetical protein
MFLSSFTASSESGAGITGIVCITDVDVQFETKFVASGLRIQFLAVDKRKFFCTLAFASEVLFHIWELLEEAVRILEREKTNSSDYHLPCNRCLIAT